MSTLMQNELGYLQFSLPHLRRREITVGSVLISVNGLGVECDDHSEVLGDPLEDVPRHLEGVLLFDPEPGLLRLGLLHDLEALLPLVGGHGLHVAVVGIAPDEDVVPLVPHGQILHLGGLRLQTLKK